MKTRGTVNNHSKTWWRSTLPALLLALALLAGALSGCGGSPGVSGPSSGPNAGIASPPALTTAPGRQADPYYADAQPAPGVTETEKVSYYNFSGSTPAEMRDQINAKRPQGYDGFTNWDVKWEYDTENNGKGYVTSFPKVNLTVSYTMPHWDQPPGASQAVIDSWTKYYSELSEHEMGHRMIAVDYANKMEQELQPGNVFPSADQLKETENLAAQGVLDQMNNAESAYDDSTGHGTSQGAQFP